MFVSPPPIPRKTYSRKQPEQAYDALDGQPNDTGGTESSRLLEPYRKSLADKSNGGREVQALPHGIWCSAFYPYLAPAFVFRPNDGI